MVGDFREYIGDHAGQFVSRDIYNLISSHLNIQNYEMSLASIAVREWVPRHAMAAGKFAIDFMDIVNTWIGLPSYIKIFILAR